MKKIFTLGLTLIALTACNIDRFPYGDIPSEKVTENPDQSLPSLLNGCYAQLKYWADPMHRCGEYAGDNIMIRGASTDAFFEFISFKRTPQNYRLQNFWDYSYKAIAQSSNVINMIKEGQSPDVDNKLGECYYIRGMLYFYLCRAYGRPYYQSPEQNLGVPIVNGTPEDVFDNLELPDRATVKESYEQAISDLRKAETLLTQDNGNIFASKEAAQALLSRVYLYMSGTYENPNREYAQLAVDYATKVIDSGKYQLLSRDEFMKYNTIVAENNKETIFAIKRLATEFSGYDHYYGVGGMYANIGGMGWGEMYASAKYLALLDETGRNDWRKDPKHHRIVDARAAFIEPTYDDSRGEVFRFIKYDDPTHLNYVQAPIKRKGGKIICTERTVDKDKKEVYTDYELTPVDERQEIYTIDHADGHVYKGVIDNFITLNRVYPQFYITKCSREGEDSHLHSPVISRLGEIYLNRAEALAKLGKYAEALVDLNIIRNRSIVNGGYSDLDSSNASERIDKERQLELAYQAERSYDVFRNGNSLKREYPGPHDQFTDIPVTDYRVVYFIPQDAINSYPGTLTQNPTSN